MEQTFTMLELQESFSDHLAPYILAKPSSPSPPAWAISTSSATSPKKSGLTPTPSTTKATTSSMYSLSGATTTTPVLATQTVKTIRTKSHSTLGGIYLYLRDAGADDTLANGVGMTPLQVAVARGHTEMVNAMMNTRRETLWVYGKASAFLYDLSEVDTFVDPVTMGHAKGALEIAIKQKNRDVLNLPLFQRILEAKWISYGRAMFTFNVFRSIPTTSSSPPLSISSQTVPTITVPTS
ncbi:hypothetical protein BC829DRAFT_418811 [Chytridium lagenaria]|nr:hypothetical protein BC829DRAFT_418811 [Chytridium lagenaria]